MRAYLGAVRITWRAAVTSPSALLTVRPQRVSSDRRIRWLLPGATVVIPPVARFVIACVSIDDPPGQQAARLRQLLSYQRTAPGRECDKNASEHERQGSELSHRRHAHPRDARCSPARAPGSDRAAGRAHLVRGS